MDDAVKQCAHVALDKGRYRYRNMYDSDAGPLVLLVEDNERNARLFHEILTANGYQTALARDGHECLRNTAALRPDLILMDLQLPGMDGLSVIAQLRRNRNTESIPIIAVTAHAMPEHRERFLAAGCCSYIPKPISYQPFLQEIARVLAEHGTSQTTEVLHAGS